jgi:hypothetical protein
VFSAAGEKVPHRVFGGREKALRVVFSAAGKSEEWRQEV